MDSDGRPWEDEDAATASKKGVVHVRCTNGTKFSVEVDLLSSVEAFKNQLSGPSEIPAAQQRLIYKGRVLKDEHTLDSYGLQTDHTVHLVRGAPSSSSAGASAPASATTNPSPPPNAAGNLQGNIGGPNAASNGNNLFGFNLNNLNGLGSGGLPGLGVGGIPEFQQVEQQLLQNPNLMRDMMNTPVVQSLINNPDLMRNLIMNNPQMRQIMDRNPELAHILNDPATLRQTLDAARNPELLREMMRNTDRAMSNIEASPEGFNMLRRMYETVQEPLLNAAARGTDGGNNLSANPFAALLGGQAQAQNQTPSTTGVPTINSTGLGIPPVAPNTAPLPNPWNPSQNTTAGPGTGGNATGATNEGNVGVGLDGLAGLNLSDLGGLGGGGGAGLMDPGAMLQNPAMLQMMQNLLSNPQYLNQIINMQPHLRSLFDTNPQLREMLQNPDFLQQISSPESLQQMLAFQQAIMGVGRQQQTGRSPGDNGAFGGTNAVDMNSLFSMMGALGGGTAGFAPEVNTTPPEQRYASQLAQLQDMGFVDTEANIRALTATGGNVHAAVDRLLGSLN